MKAKSLRKVLLITLSEVKEAAYLKACITLLFVSVFAGTPSVSAQSVIFDFDRALLYASLPIDQTTGRITAYPLGIGQRYSVRTADLLGLILIYPGNICPAALLIKNVNFLNPTEFSFLRSIKHKHNLHWTIIFH